MRHASRRYLFAGFVLACLGLGCGGMNPFLIPYMFSGGEGKTPAEYELAVPEKKKEAKVVVLVSCAPGLHPDLAGVDRMLNSELVSMLDAGVKANEEKVLILKMPKIDEFKTDNPNWRSFHPFDIGKKLGADYVIDVEIEDMDLFKPESRGRFLKGHATISVNAYDMSKTPLKDPTYKMDYTPEYPRLNEEEVEGRDSRIQVSAFRLKFVQIISAEIAVKFTASTPQRRVD